MLQFQMRDLLLIYRRVPIFRHRENAHRASHCLLGSRRQNLFHMEQLLTTCTNWRICHITATLQISRPSASSILPGLRIYHHRSQISDVFLATLPSTIQNNSFALRNPILSRTLARSLDLVAGKAVCRRSCIVNWSNAFLSRSTLAT